jgi:predicted  nucleic acid-binding Zn-ribbon protein
MSDITQKLVDESNHHGGGLAELLEAAASEIDLLRDEKADLAKENTALRERVKRMEEALRDIVNPLGYLRREAEKEGKVLNGMACIIANDPQTLREIAQAALKEGE